MDDQKQAGKSRVLVWAAALGAPLAVLGALAFYFTSTPEIINSCSGAFGVSAEHRIDSDGLTEYVMPLEIGDRYGFFICAYSSQDIRVDNVYVPVPPRFAIQPVGWEITGDSLPSGDASRHGPHNLPEALVIWFEGAYCNTEATLSLTEVTVDFTYEGRARTTTIPFRAKYSVFREGGCTPELRATDEAEGFEWGNYAGQVGRDNDRLQAGSISIAPEAISRDLCRYLRGIRFPDTNGVSYQVEPLEERAVFQIDPEHQEVLIDAAVLGICPEFADRRDELQALAAG